ncbi:hypothetical protein [Nocardiopsis lambiniae]|uniref:Uncharacterized protein n=1 Tax=Nocardiopsis lambiniae TaxID=3075539 RepID=A0ABU2MD43_9ACTN|nr:hypothetical protein [Nocardiopsis sp. DSM 44743]MDT0330600.1 hypothetical protein [Nocardiopsis sp. DSM 44743]
MSNDQDPWIACYRALLPWTKRFQEGDSHRAVRIAVERSLVTLWGGPDPERPATDADVHAIVAACNAYHQGWFDAVIGAEARRTWPDGERWPFSLWVWQDSSRGHGRGRAFRDTIGEHLDFFARFRFQSTLDLVGYAEHAARAATGAARQRAADAVVDVLEQAWTRVDREGWDDAGWYEYIEVEELVGWTMAALRIPGLIPSEAAERVYRIAEQGAWDGWSEWSSKSLPAPFLAQAAQAVADCVR